MAGLKTTHLATRCWVHIGQNTCWVKVTQVDLVAPFITQILLVLTKCWANLTSFIIHFKNAGLF